MRASPCGSNGKASAYNAGDLGSIPGLGRSSGEGNGNPLQYSCLEKSHGWRSPVGYSPRGRKESDTTEQLYFFFMTVPIPQIKTVRLREIRNSPQLTQPVGNMEHQTFVHVGASAPNISGVLARASLALPPKTCSLSH